MKTKTYTIVVITLAVAFLFFAQHLRPVHAQQTASAKPDPKIIAKLAEVVAIRERLLQSYELMLGAGRAPVDGSAAIDLAEARIDLARERGHRDEIISALKDLVGAQDRLLKRAEQLRKDNLAEADLEKVRARLLEAEVRLLRAEK